MPSVCSRIHGCAPVSSLPFWVNVSEQKGSFPLRWSISMFIYIYFFQTMEQRNHTCSHLIVFVPPKLKISFNWAAERQRIMNAVKALLSASEIKCSNQKEPAAENISCCTVLVEAIRFFIAMLQNVGRVFYVSGVSTSSHNNTNATHCIGIRGVVIYWISHTRISLM